MSCAYEIATAFKLIYIRLAALIEPAHVGRLRRAIAQDAAFDPGYNILVHVMHADVSHITSANMEAFARSTSPRPGVRRAIVGDQLVVFGLGRMYQTIRDAGSDEGTTSIFRTLEEGLRWLDANGYTPGNLTQVE